MRKFLLSLMLLAMLSPLALRAGEFVVGTVGGSTVAVPFRNNNPASYAQSIYFQSELGGAMTITGLAYNCATPAESTTADVKIYIGESTKDNFNGAQAWVDGLTLVYEGTNITIGGEEWEGFTFTTPYEYSGTQNLVIAVSTNNTVPTNALKWNYISSTDSSVKPTLHNSSSSAEPVGSGSMKSYKPYIKLFTEGENGNEEPEQPENPEQPEEPEPTPTLATPVVTATALDATTISLSWDAVADSALYQIYLVTDFVGETYETSYIVNYCYPNTQHCFSVIAIKDNVMSETSELACVTTPAEETQGGTEIDTLFFYDFNNGSLEGWREFQGSGSYSETWQTSPYSHTAYKGIDNSLCLVSISYDLMGGSTYKPNDYIVTSQAYQIAETSKLSWYVKSPYSSGEYYEVVVSNDNENWDMIYSETNTDTDAVLRELELSDRAGQTLYVGFRHYRAAANTSAAHICIDNVTLTTEIATETPDQPEIPADAEIVTIGEDGNLSSYYTPICSYYTSYALTQQIYTAEELGGYAGTITSLSFKLNATGNCTRKIYVYLNNTEKEYYASHYDWVYLTAEDEPVFEGEITTPTEAGWFTINFTKPFEYTGGNLAVTINDKTGGYTNMADSWASYPTGKTAEDVRSMYVSHYNQPIDHTNLSVRYSSFDQYNHGSYQAPDYEYINNQARFTIIPGTPDVEVPEALTLGDVLLDEYWTEKTSIEFGVKAINTTITNIAVDNDFFVLSEIDYTSNSLNLGLTYNRSAEVSGEVNGTITVTYTDGTKEIPVTATVYTPATPDVYEVAQEVTFTEGVYTDTPAFATLHDNYIMPQEVEDGNAPDAVYTFELATDALLSAKVTGTNANLAIYKEDFNGEGGPSRYNNYSGVSYTRRSFFFDFSDGTLTGWNAIDEDGDGYNWEIVSEEGLNYVKSYSWLKNNEGVTVVVSANNVMVTEQVYNITANSKLSFDAYIYSHMSEYYKDKIKVQVSKNGETFTLIEEILPAAEAFETITIDLGAKFAELGLEYGDYYVALRHEEVDKMFVCIDNITLTNDNIVRSAEKVLESVYYPAGKYYLVAAAEEAFSVEIALEEAPLTPPTEIFASVTETSVTLTWEDVEDVESYNIYRGETLLANVTEPTYTENDLTPYTEYCYIIKSVAGDNESFASEEICVKTKDLTVVMPENLTATAENSSSIVLTWDAVANATGYNVYNLVNQDFVLLSTVAETTYTVTGLEANTEYCFSVSSVRNEQESEMTAAVCETTNDLQVLAPTNLVATVLGETTIALTWQKGENATSYNVYRNSELVTNVTGLLYSDNELAPGTQYCYVIKGVRNGVESEASNEACATTEGTAAVVPAAPKNLSAIVEQDIEGYDYKYRITMSWDAVEGADSYNVYVNTANATDYLMGFTNGTSYVAGSNNEGTIEFYVKTVIDEVESESSEVYTIVIEDDAIEEFASSFNIYPNPANDKLFIEAEANIEEVSVYTLTGVMVYNEQCSMNNVQLNVSDLNSGVYFVKVVTNNGETVKRFIKK